MFQCSKHGQHLQAVDVPCEMVTTPQTAARVATPDCSPTIASVMRRQGAPSTGLWDKNQGFVHMSKARRHRRMTKIYHIGRSCHQTQQSLKLLDSGWPAFSYSRDCREDRLDPSRGQTCLHRGRIPHHAQISGSLYWRKHTFLALSLNPSSFVWARTASRCWTVISSEGANINQTSMWLSMQMPWSHRGARAASTLFEKVRGESARPKGRTRYWYALPPKQTSVTSCDGEGWRCGSMPLLDRSWKTSPRTWSETPPAQREHPEIQSHDWAVQLTQI